MIIKSRILILISTFIVLFSNCSISQSSIVHNILYPKAEAVTALGRAIYEIQYFATHKQVKALRQLSDETEIDEFLHDFWEAYDPTPGTLRNEFRDEMEQRLGYVDIHYPSRKGWNYSDRGRVYLIYGPPTNTIRDVWVQNDSYKGVEVWVYDLPAGDNPVPPALQNHYPGSMQFMFADTQFLGIYV